MPSSSYLITMFTAQIKIPSMSWQNKVCGEGEGGGLVHAASVAAARVLSDQLDLKERLPVIELNWKRGLAG